MDMVKIESESNASVKEIAYTLDALTGFVKEQNVTSKGELADAGDLLKNIKKAIAGIDEERKKYTTPLLTLKKKVDDLFKPFSTKLEALKKQLEKPMLVFQEAEEKRQQAWLEEKKQKEIEEMKQTQAKLEETAAETNSETVIEMAVNVETETKKIENREVKAKVKVSGEVATTYVKKTWVYDIVDEKLVPNEYLSLDDKKVKAALKLNVREIKGLKIYQKTDIGSR